MMEGVRLASRMPQLARQLVTCIYRSRPPMCESGSFMPATDHHVKVSIGQSISRHLTFPALTSNQFKCDLTRGVMDNVQLSKAEGNFVKYRSQMLKSNRLHSSLLRPSSIILSLSLSKCCKGISSFPPLMRHFSNAPAPDPLKSSLHGIQKDVSSLATKRVVRRKIPNDVVAREQVCT